MPGTWREVVYIREGRGSRGGSFWLLTLECGHLAVRQKPNVRLRAFQIPRPRFAPKRCRCRMCQERTKE